ncbi:B12-binding domain-containing protein [Gudongella sp. DL1XJH-153]|uniref:B12-binding domain-containing protein n=1 Tax=Gudongella sp. DL1XJH-153 TaxID=3409804 RepID=UPI003BB60385
MSNFGTRLKEARKKTGITQKDLSSKLGIAQSTVANYEKNTRFPGETILREISEYLNISTDFLLGIEETVIPSSETSTELTETVIEEFLENLIKGKGERAKDIAKKLHSGGIKTTEIINGMFIPVLHKIGEMWEKSEITVAQEHYSSGIISSLLDYLSELQNKTEGKSHVALFMSPGEEEHTLSLRFVSEFFKEAGWKIIFIGRSIPLWDLGQTIEKEKIDLLVLSVFSTGSLNSAEYLIRALKSDMDSNHPKIFIGGRGIDSEELALKAGADIYLEDIGKLQEKIREIEEMIR